MDVTQLVKFADTHEHLGRVEPGVLLLEYTRIVQQGPEVTTGYVFLDDVASHQLENRSRCLGPIQLTMAR